MIFSSADELWNENLTDLYKTTWKTRTSLVGLSYTNYCLTQSEAVGDAPDLQTYRRFFTDHRDML